MTALQRSAQLSRLTSSQFMVPASAGASVGGRGQTLLVIAAEVFLIGRM